MSEPTREVKSPRGHWLQLAAAVGLIPLGFLMRRIGLEGVYTGRAEPFFSLSTLCGVLAVLSPLVIVAGVIWLFTLVALEILGRPKK
jgi:hypothetical protein